MFVYRVGRALRPTRTGQATALRRSVLNPASASHIGVTTQALAGGTKIGVLLRQPLEMLATPDVLAHIAEASGGNEGRDTEPAQVKEVEGRALLGVRNYFRNAQPAEPPMLPKHFPK